MFRVLMALLAMAVFSGCAATHTAISKRDLDVQTRTSTAIFVDLVPKEKRTVYMEIRSGVMEFDRRSFQNFVKQQFADNGNGYSIVDDPDQAQYQMVVYVLNLEKASPSAAESALHSGFVGAAGGAMAGAAITGGYGGAAAGGVLGAVGSTIADAWVKDVTYMLVADVQVKEKAGKGVIVRKDTQISTKVSDAGSSTQRVSEATNKKEYRTRIVTTANKANLQLTEAQDLMFQKTAYAMSGFF